MRIAIGRFTGRRVSLLGIAPLLIAGTLALAQFRFPSGNDLDRELPDLPRTAEFAFSRLIFNSARSYAGPMNTAWRDWPDADYHFIDGLSRLTIIDVDKNSHAVNLLDDRVFDYPWLYAVEVGSWQLSDPEVARLREYFARGGLLIVDDFHGPDQWNGFMSTLRRALPDRPVVELHDGDEVMHVFYDLQLTDEMVQLLRLTATSPGEAATMVGEDAHWRGIYDQRGRLMVIINHNMDLGDAYEAADEPLFPAPLTTFAYRLGINYTIYSMTH